MVRRVFLNVCLYFIGETPVCFLKNFPNDDWSANDNMDATCWMVNSGSRNSLDAVSVLITAIIVPAVTLVFSFTISERYCFDMQSFSA